MALPARGPDGRLVDPHGGAADLRRAPGAGPARRTPSRRTRAAWCAPRATPRASASRSSPGPRRPRATAAPALDPGSARVGDELRRLLEEDAAPGGAGGCWATSASRGSPATPSWPGGPRRRRRPAGGPGRPPVGPAARRGGRARRVLARAALPGWARATGREAAEGVVLAAGPRPGAAALRDRPGAAERAARDRRSAPWRTARRSSRAGGRGDRDRAPEVRGSDLVAAGVAPGPAIGRALAAVRAAVLDGEVGGRDDELTWRCVSPGSTRERRGDPDRHGRTGRCGVHHPPGRGERRPLRNPQPRVGQGRPRRQRPREPRGRSAPSSGWTRTRWRSTARCTAPRCARSGRPPGGGLFTGALRGWPDADGLMTGEPADRAPVSWAPTACPCSCGGATRPLVAAAHAGWRGLVAGVLEAAARSLGDTSRRGRGDRPGHRALLLPRLAGGARRVRGALRRGRGRRGRRSTWPPQRRSPSLSAGVPPEAVQRGPRVHVVRAGALLLVPPRRRLRATRRRRVGGGG